MPSIKMRALPAKTSMNGLGQIQEELDLKIEYERDIEGIKMGVLTDGTPFLTSLGLAKIVGIEDSDVRGLSQDWDVNPPKPQIQKIKEILSKRGDVSVEAHIKVQSGKSVIHVYSDIICLAVLEYYAFDADSPKEIARDNYRILAGKALKDLIYSQVGYDPNGLHTNRFQKWHERIELNHQSAPKGYFSVFNEAHTIIYEMIQAGAEIGEKTVVDISIGQHWSKYWDINNLSERFGNRYQFAHRYPDSHPQARSNPQTAWCYPLAALGAYREWLQNIYIEEGKFAKYIEGKVKKNDLPPSVAQLAISAVERTLISS